MDDEAKESERPVFQGPMGGFNDFSSPGSNRYENLLQQISQLNSDLQKTVAMSQSLKEENAYMQSKYTKTKTELEKVQERYLKSQEMLVLETEAKIEADKKHEALVHKWKRQLEQKAKAFEALRKQYAPPKDLEQLRVKIQEELEGPHQQRVEGLQGEIEKYSEMFYSVRREYELLKTQFEQATVDHGNEFKAQEEAHEAQVDELRRVLRDVEERTEDTTNLEKIRQVDLARQKAETKNRKLQDELMNISNERTEAIVQLEELKKSFAVTTATLEADLTELKATAAGYERRTKQVKDDFSKVKANFEESQRQLSNASDECHRLKQQLQQKELLLVETHSNMNSKLVEARSEWERERSGLKEQLAVTTEKLMTLEAAQNSWESTSKKQQKELSDSLHRTNMDLESKLRKMEEERDSFEQKLRFLEDESKQSRDDQKDGMRQMSNEIEMLKSEMVRITKEKDSLSSKLNQSQDLVSKMKIEFISLRSKNKELEGEYKILQAKHREALDQEQELHLEKEQLELKLKYLEEDFDKYGIRCFDQPVPDTHEIGKLRKKCDLYKRKLLELHEVHKKLKTRVSQQGAELSRLKQTQELERQKIRRGSKSADYFAGTISEGVKEFEQEGKAQSRELHGLIQQLEQIEKDNK